MSFNYSKGTQVIGDLKAADDAQRDTMIDFEDNYIGLVTSGSTSMVLSGSKVGIGTTNPDYRLQVAGNIGVNEYIYHNGDADTYIRFQDNDVRISTAGGERFTVDSNGKVGIFVFLILFFISVKRSFLLLFFFESWFIRLISWRVSLP